MSVPTLRATSSASLYDSASGTLSVPAPTGVAAGDLLIALVRHNGTAAIVLPTGWARYTTSPVPASFQVGAFYKVATSSEPADYVFIMTGLRHTASAVILDYYLSVGMSAANLERSYTAKTTSSSPAVHTVANSFATDLVIWALGWSTSKTATGPSGFTEKVVVGSAHSIPMGAWQYAPGSATTANYAGTTTASAPWVLVAVVLSPASTPSACTLVSPATGSYQTVASGKTFKAKYNSTDGSSCNAYAMRVKKTTGSFQYWNATTAKLQATEVWNSTAVTPGKTISATLGTGVLSNGHHYGWSIAAQEQEANLRGPFASDSLFSAASGPTLSVQGPFGTVSTSKPTLRWTATPGSTLSIIKFRVKIFTTAVRSGSGFTPTTSTTVYDSTTVSGHTARWTITTTLDNHTKYYGYVRVKETGTIASTWAWCTFTVSFDAPAKPTVTTSEATTATTTCPYVEVVVQCHTNLLTAEEASFETGTTGWTAGTNTTIAQATPPVGAPDGSYAMSLTPSAAGNLSAETKTGKTGFAVEPSTKYTAMADLLAKADARTCKVSVTWYKSTGTSISTSTVASGTDSTTAWTKVHGTATSPSDAAFAAVTVTVDTAASTSDIHYADVVGFFPGTVTTWTAGGFVGTAKLRVKRSGGTTTRYTPFWVRTASTAHPATVPSPSQKVTLKTFEFVPTVTYTYKAATFTTTTKNHSGTSTASTALKVTLTRWWEIDPTNPSSAVNAQPTQWQPVQTEQSAAHQVMGADTMIVIANYMLRQDFQATFEVFTAAAYTKLHGLLSSQKSCWVMSPFGKLDSGWFRIGPQPGGMSTGLGNKVRTATLHASTASAPYRSVMVTAVAAQRPST